MSWGVKITILYSSFVVLIASLVTMSMRQHFDLVSPDYYKQEVAYQQVIDAGKNQSVLSAPIFMHATAGEVKISLPEEFSDKHSLASIHFYSPVNSEWDQTFSMPVSGTGITISRSKLRDTRYIVKMDITTDGKKYYQESEIMLHAE